MRPIIFTLVLLPTLSNITLAQDDVAKDTPDVSAIKQLFAARVESFNGQDLKRQLSLFTEEATYYSSTGKLSVSGHQDIGLLFLAAWNGPMKDTTLSEKVVRVEFLGADGLPAIGAARQSRANVAIVEFKIAFHAPEDSPITYDELRGVRVLVKRDGRWRIHTSCQTPFDKNATLTPERFAEIKENYRAEYDKRMGDEGSPECLPLTDSTR